MNVGVVDASGRSVRSPLKGKPLRLPGQSVEERRRKLLEDRIETPMLLAAVLVPVAGIEWYRSFTELPYLPKHFTAAAVLALLFAAWRFFRLRPKLKALRQAADGEKAVGQFLEDLRAHGYKVFHDIVGDGFNLDHVVIGRAGVFAVETKTWSKPHRGDATIRFDGARLTVGDWKPDERVVIQARAQAGWLRELLHASTGRVFVVRSVVLFPGWFVEQVGASTRELWVLNPKALPSFLEREEGVLSEPNVRLAAYHLSRFIRAKEREKN